MTQRLDPGPASIYESGAYLEANPTWHAEDSAWKAEKIAGLLARNDVTPASVCEIGTGAGNVLAHLSRQLPGAQCVGYEISPQAFDLARRLERPGLRFELGNLLQRPDAGFDLVMAIDVFEHVEDYMGFLRALRGKGRFKVFHIPLDLSVQMVWRSAPILHARSAVGHLHYFTKETALATLVDTGYEILSWEYTSHSLELPPRNAKVRLLRWPRRLAYSLHRDWTVRILGGFSLLVLAR